MTLAYNSISDKEIIDYKSISNKSIRIANGESLAVLGKGNILVKANNNKIIIKNNITFKKDIVKLSNKTIKLNNAYYLNLLVDFNVLEPIVYYTKSKNNKLDLYHKRLNYLNKDILLKTISNTSGLSLENDNKELSNYKPYFIGKFHNITEILNKYISIIHIKNQTYNSIINKTPYKALTDKKPQIGYIKIIGLLAYILVPKETRKSGKLSKKGNKGILLGFESANNFLIYIPSENKVISTKNVIIKEDLIYADEYNRSDDNDY
ncbi:hypothetical protein LOCC1_G007845 [Lachnellula occidentalis]|uniref:Retroviral polymerase SH3-like domain-containing protein n=1 Tax=Lachnellula occidentalis TaxID=215460 RepID=A0A8H8U8H1_9HELO|nr:hypothetical protein LOCC1_G007845 [Lachnellula occidentalis]